MTFTETYKQNVDKTRLISKISSFLITVVLVIEIGSNFYEFSKWGFSENVSENLFDFKFAVSFQIVIALIFAIRFIFLIKKNNSIQTTFVIWLISWFSILLYYFVTQQIMFGSIFATVDFHCADCIYSMIFLWASKPLAILLYLYLFLSPIYQILHLFIAFFHRK